MKLVRKRQNSLSETLRDEYVFNSFNSCQNYFLVGCMTIKERQRPGKIISLLIFEWSLWIPPIFYHRASCVLLNVPFIRVSLCHLNCSLCLQICIVYKRSISWIRLALYFTVKNAFKKLLESCAKMKEKYHWLLPKACFKYTPVKSEMYWEFITNLVHTCLKNCFVNWKQWLNEDLKTTFWTWTRISIWKFTPFNEAKKF